jgi:hypothetical protein
MLHILSIALALQLHNFAGATPAVVRDVEQELTRVYGDIGVRVEWDRTAAEPENLTAIRVILLPRETGDLERTFGEVMGATVWTATGTPVVYVFYRRVQIEAERYAVSVSVVLACALAHELGHVLMPQRGHSREGLMRACWNGDDFHRANQGQLRFLPEQVALIRARLAP